MVVGAGDLRRMDGGEPPAEDYVSLAASTVASTTDTDSILGVTFLDELWGVQSFGNLGLQLSFLGPASVSALSATASSFSEHLQDFTLELAIRILYGFITCLLQGRQYG